MRFGSTKGTRRFVRLVTSCSLGVLALGFLGCEEGMSPRFVISPGGDPIDFIPSGAIRPGTELFTDSLYVYDRDRFEIYSLTRSPFVPVGTDDSFIKRGEVLSVKDAITSGHPEWVSHPDAVPGPDGDLLRQIYSKPYLFGFERGEAATQGFIAGTVFEGSDQLLPINTGGPTWWDYNHAQTFWARRDSVVEQVSSETSVGGPEWRIRSRAQARVDLVACQDPLPCFLPNVYDQDIIMSSIPGLGLFAHGWTLIAERDDVVPADEFRAPVPQQNPRFFWVSKGGLGGTSTSESEFTSIDQCVDGLWGQVKQFPLQLAGPDLQVGQRYITWTYIQSDSSEIRKRATGEGSSRDSLRCIGFGVPPQDIPVDSPAFPIFYMSLLARYEVSVEAMFDQLVWIVGSSQVGRYGTANDGIIDVVKLVLRVSVGQPTERLVHRVDLYYLRGIGLCVQVAGLDPARQFVDVSRLRRATVNGQFFDESFFDYSDF